MNSEPSYHAVVRLNSDVEGENHRTLLFNVTNTITDLETSIKNMFSYDSFELSLHGENGQVVSFSYYGAYVGRLG